MKTSTFKSDAMKKVSTTPYFAAYPLKAILTSVKENNSKEVPAIKKAGRLRVLPMVNPYPQKKCAINNIRIPSTVESADSNWFNNYE